MRISVLFEAAELPSLQGLDLTSFDGFMASLRRVPKERVHALDQYVQSVRSDSYQPHAGYMKLYHGTPKENYDSIMRTGFVLTKGRRAGFMGAEKVVDNQGMFLTDSPRLAAYFGANRDTFGGGSARVITCYADVSRVLDATMASRDLIRLGTDLLKQWDGKARTQIPSREWWWLLDKPDFVNAVKEKGFTGVKFREDVRTLRVAGSEGYTYMIFDPKSIKIEGRDGPTSVRDIYALLKQKAGH